MSRYSEWTQDRPSWEMLSGGPTRAKLRERKRLEAEERNAKTPRDRTRQYQREVFGP